MVYRNMIEFDAEEYNWENVAEVSEASKCLDREFACIYA